MVAGEQLGPLLDKQGKNDGSMKSGVVNRRIYVTIQQAAASGRHVFSTRVVLKYFTFLVLFGSPIPLCRPT
jgi:hypothetical protein